MLLIFIESGWYLNIPCWDLRKLALNIITLITLSPYFYFILEPVFCNNNTVENVVLAWQDNKC